MATPPVATSAAHEVQMFLIAAKQRLIDADVLFARRRRFAACYMAGYVVEMVLKHAAMTVAGASPKDPSSKWRAHFHTTLVQRGAVKEPFEQGHGLRFWHAALLHKRAEAGLGVLSPRWAKGTQAVLDATDLVRWAVDMRYSAHRLTPGDVRKLVKRAHWLVANRDRLCK